MRVKFAVELLGGQRVFEVVEEGKHFSRAVAELRGQVGGEILDLGRLEAAHGFIVSCNLMH